MMKARGYASFILQTGLEFNMTVYCISSLFCWTKEEAEKTLIGKQIPQEDWVEIEACEVHMHNIFRIIEGWNVRYFSTMAAAEQARKEFLEIIKIEDKEVRLNEYDNWIAERSSWSI